MLIISGSVMCICSLALGIYFILINQTDGDYSNIGWLPILLLCVFIILFSFGYGPIPWMMVGEIFPPQIKVRDFDQLLIFNYINTEKLKSSICTCTFIDIK